MSTILEAVQKFLVDLFERFSKFLKSVYALITGRSDDKPKSILIDGEHPAHDENHVSFTRSVTEKPPVVSKLRNERRGTSGKTLRLRPEDLDEDLSDDASEDGDLMTENVSTQSLLPEADVPDAVPDEAKEPVKNLESVKDSNQPMKLTTFGSVKDSLIVLSAQHKLDHVVGGQSTDLKSDFIKLLARAPEATDADVQQAYDELCQEIPFFKQLTPAQFHEIIKDNLDLHKNMPKEDALDKLYEIFKAFGETIK